MSYTPRPGGLVAEEMALLRDEGPLTAEVIADRLNQDVNTVKISLKVPMFHGLVRKDRSLTGGQQVYSLGDGRPPLPPDRPSDFPVQRTVPADSFDGVDIDKVHLRRNTPWREPLTGPVDAFALDQGRLRITRDGEATVTLDAEHTQALRRFFAETAA